MKDQYTAADMASAKADGFRDGLMRAAEICQDVYDSENSDADRIALDCQMGILKELVGDDE